MTTKSYIVPFRRYLSFLLPKIADRRLMPIGGVLIRKRCHRSIPVHRLGIVWHWSFRLSFYLSKFSRPFRFALKCISKFSWKEYASWKTVFFGKTPKVSSFDQAALFEASSVQIGSIFLACRIDNEKKVK
jgi:hypothetical protein